MSKSLLMLEGITVQHAGELLFDTVTTAKLRKDCLATYLRSLEDVTFALVLGNGFAVSKNLPKVGNETPGMDLCVEFNTYVKPVELKTKSHPADLLSSTAGCRQVAEWLQALTRLGNQYFLFWQEFIVREGQAYLEPLLASDKAALRNGSAVAHDLIFGKDYPFSRDLGNEIQEINLVKRLALIIETNHKISSVASIEFVTRVLVAHITIFAWYQQQWKRGAGPGVPYTYVPHVTRATIVNEDLMDSHLRRLARFIMPRITNEILNCCDTREEYIKIIHDYQEGRSLDNLRRIFDDALRTQNAQELENIRIAFEREAFASKDDPVELAFKAEASITPKLVLETKTKLAKSQSPEEGVKFLSRRSGSVRADLITSAKRVFPELR